MSRAWLGKETLRYLVCACIAWLLFAVSCPFLEYNSPCTSYSWVRYVYCTCAISFWCSTALQFVHWRSHRPFDNATSILCISVSMLSAVAYTVMSARQTWLVSVLGPMVEPSRVAQWLACVWLHGILFQQPFLPDTKQRYYVSVFLVISVISLCVTLLTSNATVAWVALGIGCACFLSFPIFVVHFIIRFRRVMLAGHVESFLQVHHVLLMTVVCTGWTFYVIVFFINLKVELSKSTASVLLSLVDVLSKHVFNWLHRFCATSKSDLAPELQKAMQRLGQDHWHGFVQYICHEIRRPLDASSIALELISEVHSDLENLLAAQNGIQMAINLMDNSLLLQSIHSDRWNTVKRPFDVREAVASIVLMYAPTAKWKSVEIRASFDAFAQIQVLGDVSSFIAIIRNLLSHGINATRPGSVVFVELDITPSKHCNDKVMVTVKVTDSSEGLPPDFDAHINMPRTGLRECTLGSYLGFYISGTIARRVFNGTLTVANLPEGKGSDYIFQAEFPCEPVAQNANPLDCAIALSPDILCKLHIMVADDVPMNRVYTVKMFERYGVTQISMAKDGLDAMEQLQRTSQEGSKVDLILLGDYMPNMTGREMVAKLRTIEDLKDIRVVGLGCNAVSLDQELQFQSAGLDSLIVQPISDKDAEKILWDAQNDYLQREGIKTPASTTSPLSPNLSHPVLSSFPRHHKPATKPEGCQMYPDGDFDLEQGMTSMDCGLW